ncbi:conserved hypothetical protein [Leishmania major strain Friedlin]|uniref:Uncharacterized protein n=1 Tax=Leishmania major TaxID=5664 RepID=Q4QCD8_LEIMA|nr:conserved hypothetical protein [Leishmania major strain Friedlin]CAG9573381.1 hypothetical_protein_-_conserved [Leishmania major strain Friedlin]CAJ04251.1 conserved hypothetical protein [Leishmania major strain Friedlin]|eukprot:XP_001683010.1 conserved hypothetical protein [Leishmania major strain Friedlin]
MQRFAVSNDGKLAWGSCFASCHGGQVPAVIKLVRKAGDGERVEPDCVAFSSFNVARSARLDIKSSYSAGDHVVLAFNDSDSLFAATIVRCDTWAVQWAIEKTACLTDASVTQLAALCANTVCGVATASSSASSSSPLQRLFVASRFDVPTSSRKANKEWRQFLAPPRSIEAGLEEEGIASISAFDKNTLLVLTGKGSLALVRLDARALKEQPASASAFYTVQRIQCTLTLASIRSRMVVYNDGKEHAYAAVYSASEKAMELVYFHQTTAEVSSRAGERAATVLKVATSIPIDDVRFAGSFHLAVSCSRIKENMQFVGLVPGADAPEAMVFDPLTVPYVPIATLYSESTEEFVVISSSQEVAAFSALTNEQKVASLIGTTLKFSTGPFSQASLNKAAWGLISNPFRHYGPKTRRHTEEESGADEEDLQLLQGAGARSAGRWTPVTLCYALATLRPSSPTAPVAVFAVETAPFLHTRLIKQWHNATTGLKTILGAASTKLTGALALPWNPRHVRRALRLFSQDELSSLLHRIATTIAASERVASPVSYPDATTTAVDIALHVITLARQMGATLKPEDVRIVAIILRAARESSHELLRYSSCMELLIESHLQQRAMDRVLARRASARDEADEVSQTLEGNFYGIAAELQTERTLHTRYTSNAWAQHLGKCKVQYKAEAESALRLLAAAHNKSEKTMECALSDWRQLGSTPHQDLLLNQFEHALL